MVTKRQVMSHISQAINYLVSFSHVHTETPTPSPSKLEFDSQDHHMGDTDHPRFTSWTATLESLSTITLGIPLLHAKARTIKIPHNSAHKTLEEPILRQNPNTHCPSSSLQTPPHDAMPIAQNHLCYTLLREGEEEPSQPAPLDTLAAQEQR